MAHTPGPFKVYPNRAYRNQHPNHNYRYIATADFDEDAGTGQVLAAMTDSPEIVDNAHLFEAAPELLREIKQAEEQLTNILTSRQLDSTLPVFHTIRKVRNEMTRAIAKAEGK